MTDRPDFFRDFGILPGDTPPPEGTVRSHLPRSHVFGQYAGTVLMSSLGLGMAAVVAFGLPFPAGALAGLLPLGLFGTIVYLATRNDYHWVELDGTTIRACHLYTRRLVERPIT